MTSIVDATAADVADVQRLMRQLHADGIGTFDPTTVRQAWRSFVAKDDGGTVVGYLLGAFTAYGMTYESSGTIEQLVVDEGARGTGIGEQLVAAWKDWLRDEGVPLGFVSTTNELGAATFYERVGFTRCTGPWLAWSELDGERR